MHLHRTTRRLAVVATIVVLGLAACGDDDDGGEAAAGSDTTTTSEAEPRTIETEFGDVEVPPNPERVVALDEYAALSALALGVEPVLVFGSYQSEVGGAVLADAGVEVAPASAEGGPNLEAIAAADPDLILFSVEAGLAGSYDDLAAIAPAVAVTYNLPWRDVINETAFVFGAEDEAARIIGVLEEHLAPLQEELAGDPRSVSVLADTLGMVFAASMDSPMSALIEEAGFDRPPAQAEGEPDTTFSAAIMISLENLGDHDADEVVVLSGAYYDADTILNAPTYQTLPAVEAGRTVVADGDMWFGTYPFAIYWLIEDLAALHAGEGQDGIGTMDDVDERWAAYQELVG